MNHRLPRCRALLDDHGLDGVVVSGAADVRYLSGFRGDDATLVIGRDAALICTDSRYWEQVREETTDFELVEAPGADLIADTAAAAERAFGAEARLGFQGASLSHEEYRRLRRRHRGRLRDLGDRVSRLRAVKDAAEIAVMRRAAALTDEALGAVVARGLMGRREADVAWDLLAEYHRLGADGEAFSAIVAGGAHGAHAHAIPGGRIIAAGDLVVIDTGARVDGYCSDITRTLAAGEPGPYLRSVYEVVLEAQLAGLAAVREGAHGCRDVDAAARTVIAAAGFGDRFGHGTGHGVGLEVHEAPGLGRTRGDVLAAGMICTVEPGIYIEGLAGVRIEDTVLVTASGGERLTMFPKEFRDAG
jgi:Xaa-Pro aminopeptidase